MMSDLKKANEAVDKLQETRLFDYPISIKSNKTEGIFGNDSLMVVPSSIRSYRDRIYIVKDILSKLGQHGELNKSNLISYCGLNLKKHKYILDDLEANRLIIKIAISQGKRRTITIYKPTVKGLKFCAEVLQSYEKMFPRKIIDAEVTDNALRNLF